MPHVNVSTNRSPMTMELLLVFHQHRSGGASALGACGGVATSAAFAPAGPFAVAGGFAAAVGLAPAGVWALALPAAARTTAATPILIIRSLMVIECLTYVI